MKDFRYIVCVEKLITEDGEGIVIKAIDKLHIDDQTKGYNIAFPCDPNEVSDKILIMINTALRELLESILIDDCILESVGFVDDVPHEPKETIL
jgi:hypothetical protein